MIEGLDRQIAFKRSEGVCEVQGRNIIVAFVVDTKADRKRLKSAVVRGGSARVAFDAERNERPFVARPRLGVVSVHTYI
jgi:hypothetical protein